MLKNYLGKNVRVFQAYIAGENTGRKDNVKVVFNDQFLLNRQSLTERVAFWQVRWLDDGPKYSTKLLPLFVLHLTLGCFYPVQIAAAVSEYLVSLGGCLHSESFLCIIALSHIQQQLVPWTGGFHNIVSWFVSGAVSATAFSGNALPDRR